MTNAWREFAQSSRVRSVQTAMTRAVSAGVSVAKFPSWRSVNMTTSQAPTDGA